MAKTKVFENVKGLNIEAELYDSDGEIVPVEMISAHKMFILRPGATEEEVWETTLVEPNIVRHTIPADSQLPPGKYRIHPYVETLDGYKGRAEWFAIELFKYWK